MEKISRIVRGNSRVSSTDLKSAAAVRPGTPSFGRPVGESTTANVSATSTANRAVAIHNEMADKKKSGQDQVVQEMADSFFMTRIARPEDMEQIPNPEQEVAASAEEVTDKPPAGYRPRGSYVDVRA